MRPCPSCPDTNLPSCPDTTPAPPAPVRIAPSAPYDPALPAPPEPALMTCVVEVARLCLRETAEGGCLHMTSMGRVLQINSDRFRPSPWTSLAFGGMMATLHRWDKLLRGRHEIHQVLCPDFPAVVRCRSLPAVTKEMDRLREIEPCRIANPAGSIPGRRCLPHSKPRRKRMC